MALHGFVKIQVSDDQSHTPGKENSKLIGKIKFVPIEKIDDPDLELNHINSIHFEFNFLAI